MEKAIKRYFPIFVIPTFAAFIIGFVAPFIMGLWLSFCEFTTVTDAKFVGISNYIKAFADAMFRHAFVYTSLFTIVSLVIVNVIAFAIALALTQKLKGTNIFRTVFFMPNLIGGIVLGYIWQLIFSAILSKYNMALALNEWLGFAGLVILVAWQQIGYMMIIYIAGLQAIPMDVIEAAQIDGANAWQGFWRITFPLLGPFVTINMVLSLKNALGAFDQVVALTGGGPDSATETVSYLIYNNGLTGGEYAYQTADAVVYFILLAVIAFVQLRFFSNREQI